MAQLSLDIVHADFSTPQLNQVFQDFAKAILGRELEFGPCSTMGVLRNGELSAVVVFHDWRPEYGTIEITGAAKNRTWLSRRGVNEIAVTCFDRLQVNQIIARCDVQNATTSRIFKALGFEVLTLPNMRGAGRDELFFYMTRDAWTRMRFAR